MVQRSAAPPQTPPHAAVTPPHQRLLVLIQAHPTPPPSRKPPRGFRAPQAQPNPSPSSACSYFSSSGFSPFSSALTCRTNEQGRARGGVLLLSHRPVKGRSKKGRSQVQLFSSAGHASSAYYTCTPQSYPPADLAHTTHPPPTPPIQPSPPCLHHTPRRSWGPCT